VSRIVYISGRPGAGKSSLAFPLAAELGYSLVTKDLVKEALHDAQRKESRLRKKQFRRRRRRFGRTVRTSPR
jgi:predicted kinase